MLCPQYYFTSNLARASGLVRETFLPQENIIAPEIFKNTSRGIYFPSRREIPPAIKCYPPAPNIARVQGAVVSSDYRPSRQGG